jgi:hypothetical protein
MHMLGKQTMHLLLVLVLAASTLVACGAAETGSGSGGPTASVPIAMTSSAPSATASGGSPTVTSVVPSEPTSNAQSGPVIDQTGLIKALQAAGARVTVKEPVEQPFLQVSGRRVTVDGQDVQVFEYSDVAAAQPDARTLADILVGKGTTMVDWIASAHAYQAGRLIALYIGDDAGMLKQLQQVLGAPIAELQRPDMASDITSTAPPAARPAAESLDLQGLIDALTTILGQQRAGQ